MVTDSTADLPKEWAERYDIEVVPLKVLFGTETFRDGVDIDNEEFFRKLSTATKLPTTSAPSPGEFAEVYERLAKDHDGCISIHIGAQLSATAEAARVGAQSVEGFKVDVVDSETVTFPMAFLCRIAAECETLEQASEAVKQRVPKCVEVPRAPRHAEVPRGWGQGMSRAAAVVGTMLNVKPILLVADRDIKPVERVRTRARAIPRMVDYFRTELPVEHVAVVHAQAADEAELIAADLRRELPDQEIPIGQIGSVLGTHTGPKAR